MICLDIETNMSHDKIWVAITENLDTGEVLEHYEASTLQSVLDATDYAMGHNVIGFDFPVLERVWGIQFSVDKMIDTLVMSRLYQPVLENGHSLKAWGKRLAGDDTDKIEFTDFDGGLTDEMVVYCKQDVHVNIALYHKLKSLFIKSEFSWQSLELENWVAYITSEQERNGFKLNVDKAQGYFDVISKRMEEIELQMTATFPPITTKRISEKTGKPLKDHVEWFNPASRQQVAKRLKTLGAKFTEFTETGQEVINEKTLQSIDLPEARLLEEYFTLQKRHGLFAAWLKALGDDGRIHGRVNTLGAVTFRMTHSTPNMAQVPSVGSVYGSESRSCFTVDDGNVLVGCDASGLELRMLAHYMNDSAYTKQILEGDIHTYNQQMAGLETRNQAKTFIYATLYGAGDAKVGSVVGGSAKRGKQLKQQFATNVPAYGKLVKKVTVAAKTGKVQGLDGRWVRIRHEHAALNTLLQSAGAIVMKVALVEAYKAMRAANIDFKIVANVHDELQVEAPKHFGKAVGMQLRHGIIKAGEILKLHCPLDGEYKIGNNWAETH